MRFVNKIAERNGNTQRAVWINLNQLQLNNVQKNSNYPSDFSIRTNSIKKISGRITSISVPKSVKRCSVRSSANFTHAGITNRSSKVRNPPSMRTHFAAVSLRCAFVGQHDLETEITIIVISKLAPNLWIQQQRGILLRMRQQNFVRRVRRHCDTFSALLRVFNWAIDTFL